MTRVYRIPAMLALVLLILGIGCDTSVTDGLIRPSPATTSPAGPLTRTTGASRPDTASKSSFLFQGGSHSAQIPFQLIDQRMIITARLNGRRDLRLLVDSAFGMNGVLLLQPQLGRELGLSFQGKLALGGGGSGKAREVDMASGGWLETPEITLRDLPILVLREPSGEELCFDGIIGDSLFDGLLEIDFDNLRLQFHSPETEIDPEWGPGLPISFTYGMPVVEAGVSLSGRGQVPVKLMLDTGAEHPLYLFTDARPEFAPPPGSIAITTNGFNGPLDYRLGRLARLHLGGHAVVQPLTGFLDSTAMGSLKSLGQDGFVGLETLRQFRLLIHYAGQRLYLRPGRSYGQPTGFNMAGLILKTTPRGLQTVQQVVAGSPADRAGLRAGDAVTALDGLPVSRYTTAQLNRLFQETGRRLQLEVRRGETRFWKSLVLAPLV